MVASAGPSAVPLLFELTAAIAVAGGLLVRPRAVALRRAVGRRAGPSRPRPRLRFSPPQVRVAMLRR